MIYIVSGASRSGKSTVARRFLSSNYIPYIPLDSVMMGFMNGVPLMGIHDKLWPNEIADKIWPFLKAMCENMIYNQIDYLFEGEAVWPKHIRMLSDQYPDKFRTCFIGYSDADVVQKVSDIKRHPNHDMDWLVSQTDEYIIDHITNMKLYSQRIKEECLKYGLHYFDTSFDFEKVIYQVLAFLNTGNRAA